MEVTLHTYSTESQNLKQLQYFTINLKQKTEKIIQMVSGIAPSVDSANIN